MEDLFILVGMVISGLSAIFGAKALEAWWQWRRDRRG